jgi:hypothetical protein
MRVSDGSSTPVATASNAPPQCPDDAWTQAMAAASAKTQASSSDTHKSPSTVAEHAVNSPYELGTRANLRGYAFSDQSSISMKNNGDFELGRTSSFNYVSPELEVTATRSSSLKVETFRPGEKPNGESESTEDTDDKSNPFLAKTNLNFVEVQGSTGASAWSKTFSDSHAYFTASALGVEASGQASVGINLQDGITAQASGSVGAYVVDAKAGVHDGPLTASGEASVGAGANGNAQVAFNPLKGDAGVNGGFSAFAGAQANETGSVGVDGTGVSETAGVGAGVGVDAKLDVGMNNGDIGVKLDLGGYLGVGANVDISFNVDVPKVPKVVDDAWHDITSFL